MEILHGSSNELIEHLQEKSGYIISYSSRLCLKERLSLSTSHNTLIGFLQEIFRDCPFDYTERKNKIILRPLKLSEQSFTILGYVRDARTGERLLGSNVFSGNRQEGTATNYYGFYSLTLSGGPVDIYASYVGYNSQKQRFVLDSDTIIYFSLEPNIELPEVSVLGSRMPNLLQGGSFGSARVSMDRIVEAPALFGESDLMRGIQMLPGIQSGSEGFTGLFVRGGGPDQNLVLLDDVPVYNVGHLLGFFSIFNTDAVKQVAVTKDGFPARYGGRLSSVVDVRMKEGRNDRVGGSVSLGLLSSGVSLDGPVFNDKTTFALSFRRTYVDAFAALYQLGEDDKTNYYFFDLNGKISYELSERSKLFLSSYWGRDKLYSLYNYRDYEVRVGDSELSEKVAINDESNTGWGNFTGALRWNYVVNPQLFVNLTATYSNYRFFIGLKQSDDAQEQLNTYEQRYLSGIQDFTLKADFENYHNSNNTMRFGASGVVHRFNPGVDVVKESGSSGETEETSIGDVLVSGQEYRIYLEDEFSLSSRFFANIGVHSALFVGEGKPYWSVEPRLSLRYALTPSTEFKGSLSRMSQFVHMVGTAGYSLPTDLWLPVSERIRPMHSDQATLGVNFYLGAGRRFLLSLEGYAKSFRNILAYKESTGFFDYSTTWEDKLTTGSGESYGVEMLLQKNKGDLTGWLGYTYARTNVHFTELNDGNSYPARFDRRHDISLFMNYRFNKRITGSLTWMFGSGNPVTLPEERYYAPALSWGKPSEFGYSESVGSLNNYRMPAFHRLDLGVNFTKKKKRGERTWSFGVINAYGRQNPFLLYFSESENNPEGSAMRQLKQLSLFPFPIPYVRYSFKF
ncbi:carboxypeptidase-like regulatory domain-containing protein [Marinilabilia sp.]|uniref:TonB-dependent receptor n=1 Tax=Marinilabilia sp. TaxID=2021252 RepID=UPI0025BA2E50|nr:carboxypeptidase-like regulatory domain-containing protein [Marinilabilia sp.]